MIKVIRTEAQYDDALERVYELLQLHPALNTPEGDELDLLVTLVEAYEAVHYPMTASDPVRYLKNKMQQLGLHQSDLVPFIGDKTQVSKVLNHKRDLTLPMIKRLSKGLNIPIQRLVGV
ncbi:type II toxin-antitoxin system HigA family antitoxin [Spirosoma soli]|uniref:Type II toxin-antitoxin system HigA family antitoxin n=1 Tax=Spirosoma soli TaxID=1770529 RepID=A0ABW5MDI1_9BACT